ncbi:uncharacterized protein LOC101761833 isoform X2 [Setaria italica]|uniref:uncharacterized protein LOC101761833 isoform X2 n=1 Tax=Setaria italica TaxID=4555 RepID=UPI000BE4FA13|nr:uncharacterized protein LOC101761833 isoform X2 [Setaria italica]
MYSIPSHKSCLSWYNMMATCSTILFVITKRCCDGHWRDFQVSRRVSEGMGAVAGASAQGLRSCSDIPLSSSLCYGGIHPDAVLNKEKHMKKDEKAYHINLLNYHSKMVGTLKKWKKRWLSCADTENLFRDNPADQKQGVMQLTTTKSGIPLLQVAQSVDVSKVMSYIKVSRTQLMHIKRLKQSGDGIQIKHVSRVIGGLDKSHVKPYGALLEDEQRRLHEHWLNMSCNDVPAAVKVLTDRKVLIGKSRKLLNLELEEKNASFLRKADRLTQRTKKLGEPGAGEYDGSPNLENDHVYHSPQSMLQGGNDQSTPLQDRDDEKTTDMETSIHRIDSLNVEDHDLIVARGTDVTSQTEQNSDVQDQHCNGVSCVDNSISCCANNPDEQNEVLTDIKLYKDAMGVKDEDIKDISYEDTTCSNYNAESQQISSINYASPHINTIEKENLQVEDLDGVSYKGPPVHAHEQDQDLQSISHAIVKNSCGHNINISSEMSHPKANTVITDQEETGSIMMIPSNSSSLLPKSSGEQMHLGDFLGVNDQVAKGEKDRWQFVGPLQPHYNPPEGITYDGLGDSEIRQQYVSSGQQSSLVYLDNSVLSQQQVQLATTVFPLDNPVSFIEPLSNPQNNGQLDTAKDIEVASYPLQHAKSIKQSTGMLSLVNNHSAQSAPFPRSLKEQQQLTNQSCTTAQLHEDKDHDHNGVSCVDKGSSCCADNPDDWNGDFMDIELRKDGLGVNDEDIQEISNKDTAVNNNSESQEIKSINYTSTTIDTLDCENTELEYLDGVSYKDSSAHVCEQDHNLESISNAIVNHSCDHSANISSEKSHLKMNTVIVDQEETENIMMITSNSSTILPKSYGGQMYVEDFVDLNDRVAKGEKDRWQLAGPLQSHDHPPENINNGSGDLQITQPYLASEHQSSSVCLDNGVFSQQQAQLAKSVFPVDNPASVIEPFSNPQGNGQLQTGEIGAVSDTLQHACTIKQLIDESDDGLCAQLHEDYYADVSSPIKVNPPVSEQHSYTASASIDHNRHNWFPEGCQLHNSNLCGLESGDCLAQALPVGSSTDGALISAISQYKQPSAHMEHEAKNQVGLPKNVLPRTQEASPPFPDTCNCTQNMASSGNSDVAPDSLDNMQFTNFIQSNPGRAPDFTNRPSGGHGPDNSF